MAVLRALALAWMVHRTAAVTTTLANCQSACNLGEMLCLNKNASYLLKDVRKDYDGAEKMYRKAIELVPKHTSARWNLSIILEYQKKDIAGAVKLVEEYKNLGGDATKATKRLAALRGKL